MSATQRTWHSGSEDSGVLSRAAEHAGVSCLVERVDLDALVAPVAPVALDPGNDAPQHEVGYEPTSARS